MDALDTIDVTLKAKGFVFASPPAVYHGPLKVHGNEARIEINIPDVTFARLPVVRLLDRTKLPIAEVAHLLNDGDICYVGEAGLPLDLYNPGGSILRVLEEAAAALERSFGGGAGAEFERELASYWNGRTMYVAIPPATVTPSIEHGDAVAHTAEAETGIVIVPTGAKALGSGSRVPVTILNFDRNLRHTAAFKAKSIEQLIDYVQGQENPPSGWREAIVRAAASNQYAFLRAPNAIVGWRPKWPSELQVILGRTEGFRAGSFGKLVERSLNKVGLERVVGREVDLRFTVERNLAGGPTLIGKRVALVGCGTIGGYLGRMLAQGGAGCGAELLLYDTDRLSPGNLGRHVLGFGDLGKNKAKALADHLENLHPDIRVKGVGQDALQEWDKLAVLDLIVDATGEQNVSTVLNEKFLSLDRTNTELALLHSWVFGNGVAAQSFLNAGDGHACYRCLKTGFDGEWRYNPLRDPKSPLRQAAGRCGEAGYVPFGVDASSAAATLTFRAALDWAGSKLGKRLRTTIVDHEAGRDNLAWVSPQPLKGCPACDGRGGL